MDYILCNIQIKDNSILENYLDQELLKEIPFMAKVANKVGGKKEVNYDFVLIPYIVKEEYTNQEVDMINVLASKIFNQNGYEQDGTIIYSISKLFDGNTPFKLDTTDIKFLFLRYIKDSDFGLTYSDGSFKKETNQASYGVAKILNESPNGLYDDLTGKFYDYQPISGAIEDGTNNIGELTGIKIAAENFSEQKFQVIVSDSEYSVKAFREWIHNWKSNNYKNYAKKPISNAELIKETFEALRANDKIVLLKWVKGHNKTPFNELCDELAKNVLK
jgi:ribonuclease HI